MRTKQSFLLSNENISKVIAQIQQNAQGYIDNHREVMRLSLSLEEILLQFRDAFGPEQNFTFIEDRLKGRYRVSALVSGESYNPFAENNSEYSEVLQNMLSGQNLSPSWAYKDGINTVSFAFKKKQGHSTLFNLVISILLAIACALIYKFIPASIGDFILNTLIHPLSQTFSNIISLISGPLVLLSVMWGVFSIGDITTLSRIGKRMVVHFLVMLLISSFLIVVATIPFYKLASSAASTFAFSDLYQMVLDIVPKNIIDPLTSGNTLQIIFVAITIGIAMLILQEKTTVAAKLVEQANYIVQLIMEIISKIIPLLVFMSMFELLVSDGSKLVLRSYKFLITIVLSSVLIMLVYIALTVVRHHVSPILLIKKMASTFFIAITTASSSAAFADNVSSCEKKFGIDLRIINIGVPLGQTVFMTGTTWHFFCCGIYLAEYYGIPVSMTQVISLILLCMLLAIAAPPVPGGGIACYALVVAQLGLPAETIAMFCALNMIPEFLCVGVNLTSLQLELVELATELDMINEDILKAPLAKEDLS